MAGCRSVCTSAFNRDLRAAKDDTLSLSVDKQRGIADYDIDRKLPLYRELLADHLLLLLLILPQQLLKSVR